MPLPTTAAPPAGHTRPASRAAPWPGLTVGGAATLAAPLGLALAGAGTPWALVGPLGYAVAAVVVARHWPHRALGAANRVTLARVVAAAWLAALLPLALSGAWSQALTGLVLVAGTAGVALDGIDGRVARARGEATAFGARFDMEADAVLALVLAVAVAILGIAGWWVLALALVRYGYVAAARAWPWLRTPLPPRPERRVIGLAQAVALLLALATALAPGLPTAVADLVLAAALASLCWSFARDVAWQHGHRPAVVGS